MASKSELWEYLRKATKYSYNLWYKSASQTDNLLGLLRSIQAVASSGNFETAMNTAIDSQLSTLSNAIVNSRSIIDPIVVELSRHYGSQNTQASLCLQGIAVAMAEADETVTSRAFTNGSASYGGSNAGNGKVYRVLVDQYGYVIESGYTNSGNVTIKCVSDKHSGQSVGQESFLIYGNGTIAANEIELGDVFSGSTSVNSQDSRSAQLLTNASFDTATLDSGNLTANDNIDGWTLSDYTDFTINTTDYFRPDGSGVATQSLQFDADGSVTQDFRANNITIDPSRPTPCILRYKKSASGVTGTLTLAVGSKSTNVDLSTISDTDWHELVFGTSNSDAWFKNYNQDTNSLAVSVSSLASGTVSIDDIIFQYPVFVDGKWYLIVSGETDWLRDDVITFSDSVSNTGKTQLILSRLYGLYLPHEASADYEDL